MYFNLFVKLIKLILIYNLYNTYSLDTETELTRPHGFRQTHCRLLLIFVVHAIGDPCSLSTLGGELFPNKLILI